MSEPAGRILRGLDIHKFPVEFFGLPFLEYVLDEPKDRICQYWDTSLRPLPKTFLAIHDLHELAIEANRAETKYFAGKTILHEITRWIPSKDTTWASAIRADRISLPTFATEDELEHSFLSLLRDIYPGILIYSGGGLGKERLILNGMAINHPKRATFSRLAGVEFDRILSPDDSPRFVRWSSGHSASYKATHLFDCLLQGIYDIMTLEHASFEWQSIVRCADHVLANAREAASRDSCNCIVVAGIGGVEAFQDVLLNPLSAGDGRPVRLAPPAAEVLPGSMEMSPILARGVMAQIVWPERLSLSVYAGPDRFLPVTLQSAAERGIVPQEFLAREAYYRRIRQQILDLVRIGIARVKGPWAPRTPILLEQRVVTPFGPLGFMEILDAERVDIFDEPPGRPPGRSHEEWLVVTDDVACQLADICEKLLVHGMDPSLAMAIRRLCSAMGHRESPSDQLIDTVIAFEALVGGRPPQGMTMPGERSKKQGRRSSITERLVRSLTRLVEPHSVKEQEVFADKVREILDLRGRLVHGAGRGDLDESIRLERQVAGKIDAAIDIGVRALFGIIGDAGLRNAESSYARAQLLLERDSVVGA